MIKPHALTLRFRDEKLERQFVVDVARDAVGRSRMGILIGLVVWLLVGPWSALAVPDYYKVVLPFAYGVGMPLCALGLVLTFLPGYGLLEWPRVLLLAGQGLVFVAVQALHPTVPLWFSFSGILLTVLYIYLIPGMRFLATATGGMTVSAAYVIAIAIARIAGPRLVLHYTFFMIVANAISLLAAYQADRFRRRDWVQTREIERLLLNVLPEPIARRLQREGGLIADGVSEVTVLFADIVGFTSLSEKLLPAEVVTLLDRVFTAFDDLADRAGVEKIKTIGDAYMAVAGAPSPRSDHAPVVVELARQMLAALSRVAPTLQLRVGIHSGPVVAGVIGKRRYSYDLWGDTVNTASRMESHGLPDTIQLSDATRIHLGDSFVLEERGTIDIKGKGPMRTWLIRCSPNNLGHRLG